jgi:hypothetical protein
VTWAGRLRLGVAAGLAVVAHLVLQAGMAVSQPGWRLSGFRNYAAFDQLSYYAIAVDVAHGGLAQREPFTQTGTITYPRQYYVLIGLLSRWLEVNPAAVWAVLGLVAQCLLVAAVGWACARLSGRPWTAVLGFVPFVIGTLAQLHNSSWNIPLASHAVLWGAFADLYTLNAETIGLCLGGASLLALLLVARGSRHPRALALTACSTLGLLANVQTYSFLTVTYVALFSAGALGLLLTGSRRATVAAVVSLLALVLLGHRLATAVGPLPMLLVGLLPALPGVVLLVRRVGRLGWMCLAGFCVCASPQVLLTLSGIYRGDPFLLYRQASTHDLGVPVGTGLLAALPVAALLLGVLGAGVWRRQPLWIACSAGVLVGWALLASNDAWGPAQEPYRLWIDGFTVAATLAVPLSCWVLADVWREVQAPRRRLGVALGALALAVPAMVSTADFLAFREHAAGVGQLRFDSAPMQALRQALAPHGNHLVLPDPCTDPELAKAVDGGPVAFYSLGLAWPDHEPLLRKVLVQRAKGVLDPRLLLSAGVDRVITSDTCRYRWPTLYRPSLRLITSASYGDGGYQLWAVTG